MLLSHAILNDTVPVVSRYLSSSLIIGFSVIMGFLFWSRLEHWCHPILAGLVFLVFTCNTYFLPTFLPCLLPYVSFLPLLVFTFFCRNPFCTFPHPSDCDCLKYSRTVLVNSFSRSRCQQVQNTTILRNLSSGHDSVGVYMGGGSIVWCCHQTKSKGTKP